MDELGESKFLESQLGYRGLAIRVRCLIISSFNAERATCKTANRNRMNLRRRRTWHGKGIAWVAYANATQRYGVGWWTVGNEQWAPGALDLHFHPHSPAQYARIEASRFYPAMKAASPTPINVCVGVQPRNRYWDPIVLAKARYDCVEMHYYAQSSENITDTFLLQQAIPILHGYLVKLKGELAAAGHAAAPIYLGEIGSSTSPPGKQSQSIVQALFAGQVIGELISSGVTRATWHMGNGDCSTPSDGGE